MAISSIIYIYIYIVLAEQRDQVATAVTFPEVGSVIPQLARQGNLDDNQK